MESEVSAVNQGFVQILLGVPWSLEIRMLLSSRYPHHRKCLGPVPGMKGKR